MRPLGLGALAMGPDRGHIGTEPATFAGTAEPLLKGEAGGVLVVTEVSIWVRLVCPNGSPTARRGCPESRARGRGSRSPPDGYIVTK